MRTILYLLIALAVCSCAGNSFLKQKYTRFSHKSYTYERKKIAPDLADPPPANKLPATIDTIHDTGNIPVSIHPEIAAPAKQHSETPLLMGLRRSSKKDPVQSSVRNISKTGKIIHSVEHRKRSYGRDVEIFFAFFIFFVLLVLAPAAFIVGLILLLYDSGIALIVMGAAVLAFLIASWIIDATTDTAPDNPYAERFQATSQSRDKWHDLAVALTIIFTLFLLAIVFIVLFLFINWIISLIILGAVLLVILLFNLLIG
jgi:hypothetical protein